MFTLKNEPQDIPQLLESSFNLYKRAFLPSLPFSFCAIILMCVPHLLGVVEPSTSRLFGHNPMGLWTMTISWFLGIMFLSGLIFRLYCFCYHVPSHFMASMQQALLKFISILLIGALYSLIVLSGTMLLIVPGIILSVSLMFSFILVMTDNQHVLQTLTLSHRLVWGHWWHTVIVISIPLLINIAVMLCGFLIVSSLLIHYGMNFSQIYIATTLLTIILQTIFIPLIFSVALVLLHDLRQRVSRLPRW
ncbi:MAG: hypothetical protein BGO43_15980 [Gammaproteobacteria bacterium 39-13]|nr:hypothetical protein [Gammaproteobacteria bacterium]OJV87902.1 MAG: hypothetical protein BGO43_15980 [Gammaproteobacteria bacterium 39-13]